MNRSSRLAVLGYGTRRPAHPVAAAAGPGRRPVVRRPRRLLRLGHRHPHLPRGRHQLPALGLRLPVADRRGPGLRAQLPRLLRRDGRRRHEHPAVRAHLGDHLRVDLGRRQRRRVRRRADRVRAARLDEQLQRCDRQRPVLSSTPPCPRGSPPSTPRIRAARAEREGGRGRLPAHLQRRGLQPAHLVLARPRRRGSTRPPTCSTPGCAAARAAGLRLRQPHQPLRRPRRLRLRRVAQRPVQPDQRELPPQGHRALRRLHAHREPLAHRRHRRRHRRRPRRLLGQRR